MRTGTAMEGTLAGRTQHYQVEPKQQGSQFVHKLYSKTPQTFGWFPVTIS